MVTKNTNIQNKGLRYKVKPALNDPDDIQL